MSKPTRTISALIQRLKTEYKITIPNEYESIAISYLNFISYTRLKPYFFNLSVSEPLITFHKVIKYYDLDRKLKLLALDGLERIEIAIRALITNHMPMKLYTGDEYWYCNESNFNNEESFYKTVKNFIDCSYKNNDSILKIFQTSNQTSFNLKSWNKIDYIFKIVYKSTKARIKQTDTIFSQDDILILNDCYNSMIAQSLQRYANLLTKIYEFLNDSIAINKLDLLAFIVYHKRIPGYLLVDDLTFGKISILYATLKHGYRQKLTNIFYGVNKQFERVFINHLKLLCEIRNEVAHHANLFKTKKLKQINDFDTQFDKNSVSAYFDLIMYYLNLIAPRNSFKEKLLVLINDYANEHELDTSYWGNWK